MIVIVRRTPGGSFQGLCVDGDDSIPKAIWAGNASNVKKAFQRECKDVEFNFISLSDGWDVV